MNKRITSLALVFVMILSMLATAVPALAAQSKEITFTPDKTKVSPGDTVTYTVTIGPIEHLQSLGFTLVVPDALGYVSGKEVDGLKELLGADKAEYTDSTKTMIISGGGNYTSGEDTKIMTFTCKIPETTAPGDYKIALSGDEVVGDNVWQEIEVTWNLESSKVTVTSAPKPAESIALNKSKLTLTVGGSETLVATVTPSDSTDTVAWESNKTDVATVDSNGLVKAVSVGTATITAKAGSVSATCAVTVEAAPCTHTNKTTVAAKASTCTDQGWKEYQECADCGAKFDASGNPIVAIPYLPIDPSAHDYATTWSSDATDHWHACSRCGDQADKEAHVSSGPATETTPETCTVPATGHTHSTTLVPEVEADCTTDGVEEHYKCTEPTCGKLFEDAAATVEITNPDDLVIPALGHDWSAATCTEPKTCDRCGATDGAALGHDYEATWSSDASSHWHACSRCGDQADKEAHVSSHPRDLHHLRI